MTRALLLVGLLVTPCAAQWTGTIANRPVECSVVPGVLVAAPTGGDEAVVTTLGLWCTGTRRHAVHVTVFSTNRQGDLAFTGDLCRQGPRPNRPRAKLRQCCPLAGGTFAGTFGPTYPPDEQHGPVLLQGGTLTSLSLGVGCHHLTFPIGAVSLHSTLGQ